MLIREYELSPEASRSMKGEVSLDVTSPQAYREYREIRRKKRIGEIKKTFVFLKTLLTASAATRASSISSNVTNRLTIRI